MTATATAPSVSASYDSPATSSSSVHNAHGAHPRSVICKCGRLVTTPYCSACGSPGVPISPLGELLQELREDVAKYQAKIASPKTDKKGGGVLTKDEVSRAVDRTRRALDHRMKQIAALAEVVEGGLDSATSGPTNGEATYEGNGDGVEVEESGEDEADEV